MVIVGPVEEAKQRWRGLASQRRGTIHNDHLAPQSGGLEGGGDTGDTGTHDTDIRLKLF